MWMRSMLAALAASAALLAASAAGAMSHPTLVGTDGPGFTITLTMNGKKVKTLKPGTYTITVHDKSNIHNFHLLGPGGVNKMVTSVSFQGTKTATVTLTKKGKYTFQCDPHAAAGMKGTFVVA
jgi:plastocyanin